MCKTMREVIFEGLKQYIRPVEIRATPDKKKVERKINMLNLIPQLFYDFLARLVPGTILIGVSALVILGPTHTVKFVLNPPQDNKLFAIALFF